MLQRVVRLRIPELRTSFVRRDHLAHGGVAEVQPVFHHRQGALPVVQRPAVS